MNSSFDNDVLEPKRKVSHRKAKLPLLPSPRQLRSPPQSKCKQKRLISIGELHPFFEEIDHTTSVSSSEGDDQASTINGTVLHTNDDKDTGDFIKWSAFGSSNLPGLPTVSKSKQDSFSSSGTESEKSKSDESKSATQSSSSGTGLNKGSRSRSFRSKLKKQLSATGDFLVQKLRKHVGRNLSNFENDTTGSGDGDSSSQILPTKCSKQHELPPPDQDFPEVSPRDCPRCRYPSPIPDNIEASEPEPLSIAPVSKEDEFEEDGLILELPNWVDNCLLPNTNVENSLEEKMEGEKQLMAQRNPMEWADAAEYLIRSVGRDFRRGYLVLGERMHLTNLQAVRCLKFNPFRSLLAIGCEEGTLILLELDYEKPLVQLNSDESLHPNKFYHVPLGKGECRVLMNATLIGHSYDLRCLTWNNSTGKLVTSDEIGVMIGWQYNKRQRCWIEELINDRSTSMIRDMVVSPDGSKIAVGYEDFDENGSITGGVIVGFPDGTHIFDRKFPDSQVNFVVWYNDSTVWVVINQTIFVFDENGEVDFSELTTILLKPKSSWITSNSAPDFVVVYKESCMSFYSTLQDKAPLRIHTQISATCADWSPNGLYIVVGGIRVTTTEDGYSNPQINMFNYEGKLLQILKIPEHTITSVSWHHDSLRLALATDRQVYFASLRPTYKATSNGTVHCYAYAKDFISQKMSFWNEKTVN
ncbi:unnamed protein product [Orchesella dallaii]|uniref:IFT121/TULP4 N-terminal domain-containing protein n=1 Tax=Orchesella dallaii TaxID=48710 RepID=A0ABP1Q6E2_9HEXA